MSVQHVAPSRYHALDSLRAAMMFLGIYIHVVSAYSPNGGWPFKPPEPTSALDPTMTWIHIFRMPLFYVMAGFFAALLLERYGFKRAAVNRFWRIVVPFVGGCIILFPIVAFLTFQILLLGVPLPTLVKMALVLTATIAVLMPTYRYAVRPTALGALLNGRRYPSTLAPVAVAAAD